MQDHLPTILNFMNSFLYPFERPHIARILAGSYDITTLAQSTPETRLRTLGALLTLGRTDEFSSLVRQLDFSDIPANIREDLVLSFNIIVTQYLKNRSDGTVRDSAAALLHLLIAITPDQLLSHKTKPISSASPGLVSLEYAERIHRSVKGMVFFRELTYGPGSRKHEFGYRIQTALASQGWDVRLASLDDVMTFSSHETHDFAMLDIGVFNESDESLLVAITHLKRFFRKIFIIEPDPWSNNKALHNALLQISDQIDYIWGFTADWDIAKSPVFSRKAVLFPNVGGFEQLPDNFIESPQWQSCEFNFTGSIARYNMNRIYWILEFVSRNVPIDINITNAWDDDGLDRESSLLMYARKLASTHAAINMTSRSDGTRIITGRSIEVISLNRLLIQEYCPSFHHYFSEGEHFLEFSSIEELLTVVDFLKAHPAAAKRTCLEGYQFYCRKYSCKKMVEHIQTFL